MPGPVAVKPVPGVELPEGDTDAGEGGTEPALLGARRHSGAALAPTQARDVMKALLSDPTTRRSWRPARVRRGDGGRAHGTMADALLRTDAGVEALDQAAGPAAIGTLLAELDRVRGPRAERLRDSLRQLRERVESMRHAAEGGAALSKETRLHLHEIEGRLHEAHWLSRQAAQRATAAALDLQRLCAVTSDMGDTVEILLGLGSVGSTRLVRRRLVAA